MEREELDTIKEQLELLDKRLTKIESGSLNSELKSELIITSESPAHHLHSARLL